MTKIRPRDFRVEYRAFLNMKYRCTKPSHLRYRSYGGRGICVAASLDTFAKFFAVLGPKPSRQHSLDRIDPRLGYQKGNVRWATQGEQDANKRNTVFYTLGRRTMARTDWAKAKKIPYHTLYWRNRHWSPERALKEPKRHWERKTA